MTPDLSTFAKVRALHDRTDSPGEKASAAAQMRTLARKAGMTVGEAVSKLDAPKPRPVPAPKSAVRAAADAFNEFFNRPDFVAERAERRQRRRAEAAAIVERHGSEEAVFADTPMESALRAACEPLLGPGETWESVYRLDGWGSLDSRAKMPASVRRAVTEAWPMPATVTAAWAEFQATERLTGERYTLSDYADPPSFVSARRYVVEEVLNTLPARSLAELRARGAWLDFWANYEVDQGADDHRAVVATLRADIERMGARLREQDAAAVQSGQPEGAGRAAYPSRRTGADKRRDVLALLNADDPGISSLTDREIARRAGVSPSTVGAIRRERAARSATT